MVSKTRSLASKRAWKERTPKATCPFCHEPIYVGGVRLEGKLHHRVCLRRKKVAELRQKYAVRGFYAK